MREFDEKSITAAVLARMDQCDDARFKQVMTSLVTHLHDFVREVKLTDAEWFGAIQFLTDVGKTCTDKRQEFILLSDTLGVSILVITLNHPCRGWHQRFHGAGPVLLAGRTGAAQWREPGRRREGRARVLFRARAQQTTARPLPAHCWMSGPATARAPTTCRWKDDVGMKARGRIRTDAQGRYSFRSIKPEYYPVPTDGPVGVMLNKMGRHPMRPGHIHMIVSAPGHHAITTHLFAAGSQYIDSDAVFGVKESLVTPFAKHPAGHGAGRHAHGRAVLHRGLRLPAAARLDAAAPERSARGGHPPDGVAHIIGHQQRAGSVRWRRRPVGPSLHPLRSRSRSARAAAGHWACRRRMARTPPGSRPGACGSRSRARR